MTRLTFDMAPQPGDVFSPHVLTGLLGQRLTFDGKPAQVVSATMSPDAEGYVRLTVDVDGPVLMEVVPTHAKPVYGGDHER